VVQKLAEILIQNVHLPEIREPPPGPLNALTAERAPVVGRAAQEADMSKAAGLRMAATAATAITIVTLAACGGSTSRHAATRKPATPCAQLAAVAPSLAPVLAGIHDGRVNLATSKGARQEMLQVTGDAANWAAVSGTPAFATLFRHLRHLWNWPARTIPELASWISSDLSIARAQCATASASA